MTSPRWRALLPSLPRGRYFNNIVASYSANLFAQVLPIAIAPLLTRLYSPESFGVAASVLSVAAIVAALFGFRLEWIVASERMACRATLYSIFALTLAVSLCIASYFVILSLSSLGYEMQQFASGYGWMIPLVAVLTSTNAVLAASLIRSSKIREVAKSRVAQSVSSSTVSVVAGFGGAGGAGLLVSVLSSLIVGGLVMRPSLIFSQIRAYRSKAFLRLRILLKLRSRALLLNGLTGIVNAAGLGLPMVMVVYIYNPVEAGWFALVQRIALPVIVAISTAVGQSFWGEATSRLHTDRESVRRLYFRTSAALGLLGCLVVLGGLASPQLAELFLGSTDWRGAGIVLALYSPALAAQLIVSPMSPLLFMLGGARWLLVWDVGRALAVLVVGYICSEIQLPLWTFVAALTLVAVVSYACLFTKITLLLRNSTHS